MWPICAASLPQFCLMVKKRFACRAKLWVKRFLRGHEMPKLMDEGKAHAANCFGR